jgi:hypothetical protein
MEEKDQSKAKGGHARADALSAEERKAIARKAASARWNADIPKTEFEAPIRIGDKELSSAVLPNGKRLLLQATFLRAIGRSRSPKAGTGVLSTVDGIPFFLQSEVLKPFISEELMQSTTPIFFIGKNGKKQVGYDAQLLPMVGETYLKMRDHYITQGKPIPRQYEHIIKACDIVMRGLAHVGIIALIDEATGYQDVRDRQALQAILDRFLLKEFAAWARRFPVEFYKEIFRLRNWEWRGLKINRPQVVAKYTNDIVYHRLAPGILEELERKNPKDEKGNRKVKHHQFLTEDVGHPALAQHLYAVIGLMRLADTWDSFKAMLDRAYPKKNSRQLSLFDGLPNGLPPLS